jgi:hypothetical protein
MRKLEKSEDKEGVLEMKGSGGDEVRMSDADAGWLRLRLTILRLRSRNYFIPERNWENKGWNWIFNGDLKDLLENVGRIW